MIPKIIHYIWIGNNPKSDLINNCIASWKKYLPDYEIIEWNNERFKEINNNYATQAFECKKWAFASDYIRLYALNKYGGFYFDTDLEITQNLEKFRKHSFVSGFELYNEKSSPITALMGSIPNDPIIKDLLNEYNEINFIKENGEPDLTPNTKRITDYLIKNYSLTEPFDHVKTLELNKNSYIYPYYYFCTPSDNKDNYSIHHFNGSWLENHVRKNILKILSLKLVAIKLTKKFSKNIQLHPNEELISKIPITKNIFIMVIKIKND